MIFAEVPVRDAAGGILAHRIQAGATVLAKGTRLDHSHIEALVAAGIERVRMARLEPGDVTEDEAARRIAAALAGPELRVGAPHNGCCNLHAETAGLAVVAGDRIDAMNRLGGGIVIATLAPYEVVEPGRAVATVKVIPFAVPGAVADACQAAAGRDGLYVLPFLALSVGLVLTRVAGGKESLLDKAAHVIGARVETYGGQICGEQRCDHDTGSVRAALADVAATDPDVIFILGAASTADPADVVPAALDTADLVGIPVDPGNLLAFGTWNDILVLGLPGCARSPRLNGIDLVLPRLFAGLTLTIEDMLGLGVGGLLSEVPDRPQPREFHAAPAPVAAADRPVAAVVLAAGESKRMGPANKLVCDLDGTPLVGYAVRAVRAGGADPVIVVLGHDADRVRAALAGSPVRFVLNPDYPEGLSGSLRRGLGAVPGDAAGALVMLGDMPRVDPAVIGRLIDHFHRTRGQSICVPVAGGRRGNPVLWPREFFADMLDLRGDKGARDLIARHGARVERVDVEGGGIHDDVDTPDDLTS